MARDAETVFELDPQLPSRLQPRAALDQGTVFQPHEDQAITLPENIGNRKAIVDTLLQLAKLIDPDVEKTAMKQEHSSSGAANQ